MVVKKSSHGSTGELMGELGPAPILQLDETTLAPARRYVHARTSLKSKSDLMVWVPERTKGPCFS